MNGARADLPLGLGCAQLTAFATPRAARSILEAAFEAGIRYFDTAPGYGRGYSELLLGDFIRSRRDSVTIATKFGLSPASLPRIPAWAAMPLNAARRRLRPARARAAGTAAVPSASAQRLVGREQLARDFDRSRLALQTDRVDVYLFHEGIPQELARDAREYLMRLRDDGLVGHIGFAANGLRYRGMTAADVSGFDVLQYERGAAWAANDSLLERFPSMRHHVHSCLKDVPRGEASEALVQQARAGAGVVLFSSTSETHIRSNAAAIKAWCDALHRRESPSS